MPRFFYEDTLPYSAEQLYNLVSEIENYPEFVPWCCDAKIVQRDNDIIIADLYIDFKAITGKYTSKVKLDSENKEISVEAVKGLFEYLNQKWKFIQKTNKTQIEFEIDFKVKNPFLNKVLGLVFDQACNKMIKAFKNHADKLYGE